MRKVSALLKRFKPVIACLIFFLLAVSVFGAVLSFTNINLKSNYFNFDKAWIISWVDDDYTTDSVNAYLTQNEIEAISGEKSKQGISISVKGIENYCKYNFNINRFTKNNIYTIKFVTEKFCFWNKEKAIKWVNEHCADFNNDAYSSTFTTIDQIEASDNVVYTSFLLVAYYECAELQQKIGTVGAIENEKIVSKSEWTIKADGKGEQKALITNDETGSGRNTRIGDNVWIQWQGLVSTGDSCPDTNNLLGIHHSDIGGWRIARNDNYEEYLNALRNFETKYLIMWTDGKRTKDALETEFNSLARSVSDKADTNDHRIIDTTLNSGSMKFILSQKIAFPLYRLIVDADYLELVIETGKPKIVEVTDIKFNEGEKSGIGRATVKNIGEGNAGFNLRIINCEEGFSSSYSSGTGVLAPDESKIIEFLVTGSSVAKSEDVKGSCVLEMKEGTTGEIDRESFGVEFTQMQDCIPSKRICGFVPDTEIHAVKKCNSKGTKYEIEKECAEDETCKNLQCVKIGTTPPTIDCKWHDLKCKYGFLGFFTKVRWVASILLGLIIMLNVYAYSSKRTDNKVLNWTLAVVFGLLLGYLVYIFLFWGILIFVILLLIILMIPKPIRKGVKTVRKVFE